MAPVPKPASIPDDVSVNSVSSKVSVQYESSDSYDSDFEEVNEKKIQKLWCNYVQYFVLNKDKKKTLNFASVVTSALQKKREEEEKAKEEEEERSRSGNDQL